MKDIEGIVLSNLLKSDVMREKYLPVTAEDDFGSRAHKTIYRLLVRLTQSTGKISKEMVTEAMIGEDLTLQMQVNFLFDYGNELTPEIFSEFKLLGQKNRLEAIKSVISKDLSKGVDPVLITDKLRKMMAEVESADAMVEVSSPEQSVEAAHFMLDQWSAGTMPVTSGLPELDEQLFLSQFIGYWVIAASRGTGKSALMLNIAKANALRGVPSTLCSLEMSRELLYIRMAMSDPRAAGLRLTNRTVKDEQKMSDLKYAIDSLKNLPIYIVQGVSNIFRLDKISRRNAVDKGCKLTLFDYIQLGRTNPTDADVVRVSTVSRTLFGLTQPDLPNGYHGQAVIALSQYNGEGAKMNSQFAAENNTATRSRAPQRRAGNDDLAWSSQISNDADGILHLYYKGRYQNKKDIEIFCGKQRNGEEGWGVEAQLNTTEMQYETVMSKRYRLLRQAEEKL